MKMGKKLYSSSSLSSFNRLIITEKSQPLLRFARRKPG
jgi:hypothetical protein